MKKYWAEQRLGLTQVLSTRTRVDVRRVPGISGLPGYLLYNVIGLPVIIMDVSYACGDYFKASSRLSLSLLLCSTYLQFLGPTIL